MQSHLPIKHIAGYKFTPLSDTEAWRATLLAQCQTQLIKGTILISQEGLNINLAGTVAAITQFQTWLKEIPSFSDITFHETYTDRMPLQRLKVKIKKEIITMRKQKIDYTHTRAPCITPEELKQWLDEKRAVTLLDTRNDFEVRYGTFNDALNLHLSHFSELPDALHSIPREKPIVMFCTGGIRCEKAALYCLNEGFTNVYQLDTGILGYFAKVGGAYYQGDCFVFDERIALDSHLQPIPNHPLPASNKFACQEDADQILTE